MFNECLKDTFISSHSTVTEVLKFFRRLLTSNEMKDYTSSQAEIIVSISINCLNVKQLRAISTKILVAISQRHSNDIVNVIMSTRDDDLICVFNFFLYCNDVVKNLDNRRLKEFWEKLFIKWEKLESDMLILSARSFNAYIATRDRIQDAESPNDIINLDTFNILVAIAKNGEVSRDTRQVGTLLLY